MLFSRKHYEQVGGFNEDFSHNYNDIVFCLELRREGFINIAELSAELLHPEGVSRASPYSPEGARYLIDEGRMLAEMYPEADSCWNPNLAIAIGQGGMSIMGLNAEMLTWVDFAVTKESRRVLLINDLPGIEGLGLGILRDGDFYRSPRICPVLVCVLRLRTRSICLPGIFANRNKSPRHCACSVSIRSYCAR